MPLKDHKDSWATVGSIVQIFAILLGGAFATYKYLEAEKATRTKETLAYVDRYHKSPMHDVRMKLEGVWVRQEEKLVAKLEAGEQEYEQFVLKVVRDAKLEADIFALASFFESVQACAHANICDEVTAKSFFCSDAVSFFHLHYRFIARERLKRKDPGLAELLEKFAHTTCKRAVANSSEELGSD